MKSKKQILRKIKEFEANPMFVTGIYRLVVFLKFDDIPEKYQSFFKDEHKEKWGEPSEDLVKDLSLDIETGIRSVLKSLYKRNIVQSLGVIPMILADMYMDNKPIGRLQGELAKIIRAYPEDVNLIGRNLAEAQAVINVADFFKEVVRVQRLKIDFDIDEIAEDIISKIDLEKDLEAAKLADIVDSKPSELPSNIDDLIDSALKDYEEKVGTEDGE